MSLYRNSAWFLKGLTEFTRNGYLAASKRFVEKDLEVSMAGRSFMITGANSGIGRATAMAIAKKGGSVHMVCRNKDKAEEARADIVKESGNKEIFVHILDLSETKKINNAGCIMSDREENTEGLEKSFASNVLGVYILTKSLIALLEKSAEPRVITVSSGGMLVQKLRSGNLQSDRGRYDGAMVYAQHKFHSSMKESLRTPEQGADTAVWLAVSDAAATMPSGHFYQDRKMVSAHLPLAWTRSSQLEEQNSAIMREEKEK
ncbi:hypothetical protein CRUP_002513 [Coryphaenoides rupestris]|nr:hypothetical protein CRUP_002513 [Coryphaenoides rupestris]